jgi:hypothetical protein
LKTISSDTYSKKVFWPLYSAPACDARIQGCQIVQIFAGWANFFPENYRPIILVIKKSPKIHLNKLQIWATFFFQSPKFWSVVKMGKNTYFVSPHFGHFLEKIGRFLFAFFHWNVWSPCSHSHISKITNSSRRKITFFSLSLSLSLPLPLSLSLSFFHTHWRVWCNLQALLICSPVFAPPIWKSSTYASASQISTCLSVYTLPEQFLRLAEPMNFSVMVGHLSFFFFISKKIILSSLSRVSANFEKSWTQLFSELFSYFFRTFFEKF